MTKMRWACPPNKTEVLKRKGVKQGTPSQCSRGWLTSESPSPLATGPLSTTPHKLTHSLALLWEALRQKRHPDLGGRRNERLLATQASSSHSGMLCKGKTNYCLFSL